MTARHWEVIPVQSEVHGLITRISLQIGHCSMWDKEDAHSGVVFSCNSARSIYQYKTTTPFNDDSLQNVHTFCKLLKILSASFSPCARALVATNERLRLETICRCRSPPCFSLMTMVAQERYALKTLHKLE